MSKSSKGWSSIPAPRKTDPHAESGLDDDRNIRLAGPYRALWRAARAAGKKAVDRPRPEADGPPDPVHSALRRQVEDLLADAGASDAERRRILDSIACPCCGGTGASFAMTIRPAPKTGF